MATKQEKGYLHNRTAQGLVLVGSFICMSVTWVWITGKGTTWVDWFGFVVAVTLFFYCFAITSRGRRLRRHERTATGCSR
jgi:cobalamin biosynthesis protein CobD/CbiB